MITRLAVILLSVLVGTSSAGYTAQYSTYTVTSVDITLLVTQTVVVEGTTTGNCYGTPYPCNCNQWGCQTCYPVLPGCSTAQHTPRITNVVATQGGTTSGTTVGMFNYITYQTTTTFQAEAGQEYSLSSEGAIFCSFISGDTFTSFFDRFFLIPWVRVKATGDRYDCVVQGGVEVCEFEVDPWCTDSTSPPSPYNPDLCGIR